MNTKATSRISRTSRSPIPQIESDDSGIFSVAAPDSAAPVGRVLLLPEEDRISLPSLEDKAHSPLAPLTEFLGPQLTVANPAWIGDPIPLMRALQKKLVEHSLTLAESDRSECMDAILVVENAVQMRLRFQQMRMDEAELDTGGVEEKAS